MSAPAPLSPKIVTASREPGTDTVTIRADGVPILRLADRQALWLVARLAEALAAKP